MASIVVADSWASGTPDRRAASVAIAAGPVPLLRMASCGLRGRKFLASAIAAWKSWLMPRTCSTPARRTAASNTASDNRPWSSSWPGWSSPDLNRMTGLLRVAERSALRKLRALRTRSTCSRM